MLSDVFVVLCLFLELCRSLCILFRGKKITFYLPPMRIPLMISKDCDVIEQPVRSSSSSVVQLVDLQRSAFTSLFGEGLASGTCILPGGSSQDDYYEGSLDVDNEQSPYFI